MLKVSWILIFFLPIFYNPDFAMAQEVSFFNEGTNNNFYDQGIVDVNNLGQSTFEHTYPPIGSPTQWNDKVPCSTTAFKGANSLKFNYKSSDNGNWKVSIHRKDWSIANITGLDSLSFYFYSETALPKSALPLIGLLCKGGTSRLYALANYNNDIPAAQWTQISFPLDTIIANNSGLDYTQVKAVIFNQSENDNSSRLILIDEITAFISIDEVPPVSDFVVTGYDSHAELNWEHPLTGLSYRIYASFDGGQTFGVRAETIENSFMDFVPEIGKNKSVIYRVVATIQNKESEPIEKTVEVRDFTDDELLDMVQEYSFRYFWEGAHQATGMALERSNGSGQIAASGATGFGLMAMIVAHEREYRPVEEVKERIIMILDFLETCDRHHGAWSHWYNADTKKTQPFSPGDDGGDMVETSFVAQSLIALKHCFSGSDTKSTQIREKADQLWKEIDWSWYRQNGQNTIYWHWSPNYNFEKNMQVRGWNEALITYVMAASSPTHGVPKEVYIQGWAKNGNMVNHNRSYYGYDINLAHNWGGPLFWIHYTHHGINPHGLKDEYADYWQEHVNTAKIHYEYAKDNPLNFENYSENCWGLTASDDPDGYTAHKPMDNDNGTVSPTAALASMPYTPGESIKALKYFYRERGSELFGKYGPYDAFNDSRDWIKESYIGIDQGPIIIMIENHRTGLLWNNVMKDADVQAGLDMLGFQYEITSATNNLIKNNHFNIYPNPANNRVYISLLDNISGDKYLIKIFSAEGQLVKEIKSENTGSVIELDVSNLRSGLHLIRIIDDKKSWQSKLLIQKQIK